MDQGKDGRLMNGDLTQFMEAVNLIWAISKLSRQINALQEISQ
jgi:hypothetical protein